MFQATQSSRRSHRHRPPPTLAATGFLFLSAMFLAACPPAPNAPLSEHTPMRPGSRWDTTDLDYAEEVGRAALEDLGYAKIIRVAENARWIEHRLPRSGNSFDQTLGFWAVFTQYAVAAGVTSQADSPAPGPADVVAIGILVLGLIDAGLLGGSVLSSIKGNTAPITGPTAAPPIPAALPTAAPAPAPTTVTLPTAVPAPMLTTIPTTMPTAVPPSRKDCQKACNAQCERQYAVCSSKCGNDRACRGICYDALKGCLDQCKKDCK